MNANVTKTPFYKERVEKIEKEILAITNNATYTVFSGDDAAYLLTLLNDRKWLLDAMFVVTPEEFARMNEVNERLRELTHELHNQVANAHEKAKRAFLGKEFTVEATLKFVSTSDGAMIVRPNDDYYGSDFAKIMRVVDMLNEQGFTIPIMSILMTLRAWTRSRAHWMTSQPTRIGNLVPRRLRISIYALRSTVSTPTNPIRSPTSCV